MARLIGILGGTFDPIHYGHLRPALDVLERCQLNQVRFIPNRLPPHRQLPKMSDEQRAEWVQLAIQDTPSFVLDRRELQREGPSYMVDTLSSLQEEFPEDTLCLIMGMDAFNGFQHWHRWQAILEVCHLIVTTRPGFNMAQLSSSHALTARITNDPAQLQQTPAGQILLQCVTQLDISASQIREYLSQGRSTQFLLPEVLREKLEKAYA